MPNGFELLERRQNPSGVVAMSEVIASPFQPADLTEIVVSNTTQYEGNMYICDDATWVASLQQRAKLQIDELNDEYRLSSNPPSRARQSMDWIPTPDEMAKISRLTPQDMALPFGLVEIAEMP